MQESFIHAPFILAYYKTRNAGTPNTEDGPPVEQRNTPEQWRNTTEHYPKHQWNTQEHQSNTNVAPAEHPKNNVTIQNEFKQTS